ncbi:hypothetical protein HYH02_002719 [Chlamydomonas schloesseri]|uniref:Uncharacterized protein n=1 Tax=Chlamydomonas schloesseri TaxID=2026947 RepID=A0A836BAW9_9CHLO|nr:hypothetical protein HYH02_002719 [Chlamydomonas schloesseri]|eukprot:KAG2452480.1 hypothetical protein HYH02_002719 [Chlamydomonas schloesseri]
MNGRDKAEVLAQTSAEVMAKLAAARAAAAAASANGSGSGSGSGSEGGAASSTGSAASATSSQDWVEDWRRSDAKVNKYPDMREFTAVGSGGEDFKAAMVKCVEDVVGGPAPVSTRESSGGNYLSVRVGPVRVESPEQVLAVFLAMRKDKRLKFHL